MNPSDLLAPQMPLMAEAARDYAARVMALAASIPGDIVRTTFAYGSSPVQSYDVWRRAGARDLPVLVFWHGGGWTNGYRQWAHFMADNVTRLGMVLVTPGYRLAPDHRLPDIHADALSALHHVSEHVGVVGGAPGEIYLSGHSAGGQIAALVALRSADVSGVGVDPSTIRGCLPISGIMDLHHPAPSPSSLEERVYTMVLDEPVNDGVYSPLCWTADNEVPMVLTCGQDDSPRVLLSNQRMAALLALQAAPSELHVGPGLDHFATHLSLADPRAAWYGYLEALVAKRS